MDEHGRSVVRLPIGNEIKMRPRAGFTLIETIVTLAIVAAMAGVGLQIYSCVRQRANDNIAIGLADQVAANMQHYNATYGAYPVTTNATWWPQMITDLGSLAEFPGATPAIYGNFMAWTGPGNPPTTFQLAFVAAGGTGTWYCRDTNGLATISAPPGWGPWNGCP